MASTRGKGHVQGRNIVTDAIANRHLSDGCVTTTEVTKTGIWDFSGATSVSVPAPSSDAHASTKKYVDDSVTASATGRSWKEPVRACTAGALPAYTRTANVITASAVGALAAVDGVTLLATERLLVKDGAAGQDNGIYTVTTVGDGATAFVLTRATDMDTSAETTSGSTIEVREGTANADRIFSLVTDGTITLNTTSLTFTEVTGLFGVTAGDGINKTGNTLNIDVSDFAGTGLEDDGSENLRLAAQGNGIAGGAGSTLSVQADGSTLTVGAGGVKVSQYGVTTNEIALTAGTIMAADNVGHGTALALTAGKVPVGTAGAVTAGDVQSSTASVSMGGNTAGGAASISVGGNADSSTASISMGGSTASGTAALGGATGSATASISVGGNADSGTASVSMGGDTASGSASISVGGTADSNTTGISTVADGTGATGSSTATVTEDEGLVFTSFMMNPAAAAVNILAQFVADKDETTYGNFTQPDFARGVQVVWSGTWDGGNIELTALWSDGTYSAKTINAAPGTTTEYGFGIWPGTVTRCRNLGSWSAGTADVQTSAKLAVQTGGRTATKVLVIETSAGADAGAAVSAAGLVTTTAAPNGALDYYIHYNLAGAYTDAGHTHTGPSHTHGITDTGHTHAVTGVTATDAGHTHSATGLTATDAGHTHNLTSATATDAGHTHAAGTLADSGHTHTATGLTATDAGHTHALTSATATDAGHTHAATGLTATDAGHTHTVA